MNKLQESTSNKSKILDVYQNLSKSKQDMLLKYALSLQEATDPNKDKVSE